MPEDAAPEDTAPETIQALLKKQEKLATLGRLSAGLAHELNNPAAAGQRAAKQLREAINGIQTRLLDCLQGLPEAPHQRILHLQAEAGCQLASCQILDPLTRSDREEALTDWLEEHDVANAWKLAPIFVSGCLDRDQFGELAEQLSPAALSEALNWLGETLSLMGLIHEIEFSTGRISQLVKAIKSYSYMDQAQIQETDLHEGLENSLTMLNHKLKYGITVIRDYASDLPKLYAYGGELNQVWTNIIDNAAYALKSNPQPDSQPTLWIRTSRLGETIQIEIKDNGAGIPEAVQARMFEPFFTTKRMGEGSGLGLDIAQQIVVQRHQGEIKVSSQPGETRFVITLPIHPTPGCHLECGQ